jgi:hypothetical protein
MIDWIILALLAGVMTVTALLLYPQPISWSDEPTGAGQARRAKARLRENLGEDGSGPGRALGSRTLLP